MKLWKSKKVEEVVEKNPLDLFEIVGGTCPYCEHGPLIKFEPAQFKYQCWTCARILDKVDVYVGGKSLRAPETRWIDDRIEGMKDDLGQRLRPMTDAQYAEMFEKRRTKMGIKVVQVG